MIYPVIVGFPEITPGGRIMAMRNTAMILLITAAAGCGGGSGLYLDTDVAEVYGFGHASAKEVQMSGGLMQAGTLEYSGSGDVAEVFKSYIEAMKAQGWTIAHVDVAGDRAVGTLRKDNRTCGLEFTKGSSKIRAVIKVGTTK